MYLISDILFNSVTQTYLKVFSWVLPGIIYRIVVSDKAADSEKHIKELTALITVWQTKYIFDEVYTKGLIMVLRNNQKVINGFYWSLNRF